MLVRDAVKVLKKFPLDAHLENLDGRLCVVTENTYNGEYIFDISDPELPSFRLPDDDDDLNAAVSGWQ